MLNDTLTLHNGVQAISYVKRSISGTSSTFVPLGDVPSSERKVRVSHEVSKSGTVNSLFAVSHLKSDASNPAAAPRAAAVQLKIIRPGFVPAADMIQLVKQIITGLTTEQISIDIGLDTCSKAQALLNQEV